MVPSLAPYDLPFPQMWISYAPRYARYPKISPQRLIRSTYIARGHLCDSTAFLLVFRPQTTEQMFTKFDSKLRWQTDRQTDASDLIICPMLCYSISNGVQTGRFLSRDDRKAFFCYARFTISLDVTTSLKRCQQTVSADSLILRATALCYNAYMLSPVRPPVRQTVVS